MRYNKTFIYLSLRQHGSVGPCKTKFSPWVKHNPCCPQSQSITVYNYVSEEFLLCKIMSINKFFRKFTLELKYKRIIVFDYIALLRCFSTLCEILIFFWLDNVIQSTALYFTIKCKESEHDSSFIQLKLNFVLN